MTSEINSTYKANTSDRVQCRNELNDVIANLNETLVDVNKMKGSTVDTKVFLKIHDILKDVEQCRSNVESLVTSTLKVKISFLPDKRILEFLSTPFKISPISLGMSEHQVDKSLPQISFPISPVRSPPASQGLSGISMPIGAPTDDAAPSGLFTKFNWNHTD